MKLYNFLLKFKSIIHAPKTIWHINHAKVTPPDLIKFCIRSYNINVLLRLNYIFSQLLDRRSPGCFSITPLKAVQRKKNVYKDI